MKKQKPNTTLLTLVTIICILCGLLLIYRGYQPIDKLYKFNGTVTDVTVRKLSGKKNTYSIDFTIAETDRIYGIYAGTKDQANSNLLISKIEIGKIYTFYIDKTVGWISGRHTLGIRAIKANGQFIYQDNPKVDYVGGSILLVMGIGCLAILIYVDKRNKNTRKSKYSKALKRFD